MVILACTSCSRTPGYVISEDRMAELMADIYLGDAVVESEYRTFNNDSLRKVLMQSIYAKHGVTAEQIDTSLYWYGHNIKEYMEVSKLTEELLQARIDEAEKAGGRSDRAPRRTSLDGDSVDVWNGLRTRRNYPGLPSDFITFNITNDKNWERGDRYRLWVKGLNTRRTVTLTMAVDYNDGTTEYSWFTGPAEGLNNLLLVLDSAKIASSLYGAIHYSPVGDEISYLDSIRLVRTRGLNDNKHARQGQAVVRTR